MTDRPFRILGIQQIAVGAPDKAGLRRLWIDTLGLERVGEFRSERENVDEDIAVAGSGPLRVEVDLMQPIDPSKSPKVHEPALNHVGLWVDDLAAAVAWLTGGACASRRAASARAPAATTSASSTRRGTPRRRSGARAC